MRFPVLPLVLLAPALLLTACDRKAGSIDKAYPLTRLTERVYVVHGPNEMPNEANQAFMNNPGFVLTPKGGVVVDPGSSVQVGEMLPKKIATVTKDPVIAVFNTHIHGDHWLGNDAIRRAHPKAVIYAHPNMIAKAAVEGNCLFWQYCRLPISIQIAGNRVELPVRQNRTGSTTGTLFVLLGL